MHEGKPERAREIFQQAAARDPRRGEAYNAVGVTYYARGDYPDALSWYKRSVEADPLFGDAYYNMACSYAMQGRRDLAFRILKLAALNHYLDRELMEKDSDLGALHGDPQWREILDQLPAASKQRP